MSGSIYGYSNEDRYFENLLNRYLDEEDKEDTAVCKACGETFPVSEMKQIGNEKYLCSHCYEKFYCVQCGDFEEEATVFDGEKLCKSCLEYALDSA